MKFLPAARRRRAGAGLLAASALFATACEYLPDMTPILPDDGTWTVIDPDGPGGDSITYVVGPPAFEGALRDEGIPMASVEAYGEIGRGSAKFLNSDPADPAQLPELVTHAADGTALQDVAEFGWATFVPEANRGAVPYLVIEVDPDGPGPDAVITLVADEHLDREGLEQEPATGVWQFWRARPSDDVWMERSDGIDTAYAMSALGPEATITAVRLSLGVAAGPGISYADAVRIEPVADEAGTRFGRFAWSFEPTASITTVHASSLGTIGGTLSPGASIVSGPEGVEALQLPFGDLDSPESVPDYAVFDHWDGGPVDQLDAFTATMWVDPTAEDCALPLVFVGVDADGDTATTEDRTPFVYWPCATYYEAVDEIPTEPGWVTFDVRRGLVSLEGEVYLDELLAAEGTENAAIAPLDTGDGYGIPGGIAFSHVNPGFVLGGPVLVEAAAEEPAPVPAPALVDRFTVGLEGASELDTFDFVVSGGGGFAGYTITVPAGGGTGTVGLPGGEGSITTAGNAGPGMFTLLPGGTPAGTPGSFHVLGQSWDITPPAGFEFDSAEVCLPYDEAALTAAGYDEDDLALVHYRSDGTLDDVTTSIDTVDDIICGETDSFSPFAIGILDVDRLAGADRAATAAASSAATFAPGAPVAYVATGEDFADALSGGPAAAAQDGPVLLVGADDIPSATAAELARLQPAEIVVLGGTAAISDGVVDELAGMTDGDVARLAGADRYGTSAAVSAATFAPGIDVAYVATGERFADALTGGAAAARDGAPVLLVSPTSVPAAVSAELERLDPGRIVVLGGTAAVADAVAEEVGAIAPVTRISGSDRYGTAAAVADTFSAPTASLFVATGTAFADALTGVPAAAAAQSPILLVDGALPASTQTQVERLDPASMRILGGTAAIADVVVAALRDAMLN